MRYGKWAIPLVAVTALVGSGEAWAQVILSPDGPGCVSEDMFSSTYTATVTTSYNFDLLLKVYHNGILKYQNTDHVSQQGPTYPYSKSVWMYAWGMQGGDSLYYLARATLTSGPNQGVYTERSWLVDVMPESGCRRDDHRFGDYCLYGGEPVYAIREEHV